jgi:CRP/FNR family transcriptional regulator, dissimilatory nitrate respiration regulator
MQICSPDWPALAKSHPALGQLPADLQASARQQHFAAGEKLFHLGRKPVAMYFVLRGEVRLLRHSRTGSEVILQRTRQGFVAEASLRSAAYHCDAVAAAPSEVLAFALQDMARGLAQDSDFQRLWIDLMSAQLRAARAQCERLALNSAAERVLHFVETEGRNGTLQLHQTRKAWAAELALSHETLYRTLAQLIAQKRLRIEGKKISLV